MEQPDAKYHLYISLVKSAIRIGAGVVLITSGSLMWCGILLILAELLGVGEELV
jgi:hypothetical protein